MNEQECCPQFHPEKWEGKTFKWENKQFIKETIRTLFHIPFPPSIGKKITMMCKLVTESDKNYADKEEALIIFNDPTPFKSDIYYSVTGEVPNANNVTISGTFIAKVYDGPFGSEPKFIKEFDAYLSSIEKKAKKYYIHYAYCPKCSLKYGYNYMVIFAEF